MNHLLSWAWISLVVSGKDLPEQSVGGYDCAIAASSSLTLPAKVFKENEETTTK